MQAPESCVIIHTITVSEAYPQEQKRNKEKRRYSDMKHVKTLNTNTLKDTMKKGGCGECQTSCQSACKTSCTVGNQSCENADR